ncbi:calcineurin-like phosphoesterase C-terminal domain-containing protein [Negadavirga shengliensis]|uniref:Calcineurin-like phosphoesterase C-terminal domain-containing protein n=1 Tax=Negadavirga shengliensis TaxID=1389218 RepID=A0ABV9T2A7_9BACT
MKKLLLIISVITLSIHVDARQQATGFVYHDANQNGKKERSEKGIPGVAVSNGKEVVLTDNQGKYVLPVDDDNIIFVIKPSSYTAPLDENNLPRYFYIHKPNGSPDLKYKGVEPTGRLPKSVDFALYPQQEENNFTAIVFGDPQPYTEKELELFTKGVVDKATKEKKASFGISLGDLVGDDLDLHPKYAQVMRNMGLPWYNVMGNHDMNYDAEVDEHADEAFEATFGPANYAFNYANAHFIVLDDILYPDPRDGQGYWGGFREDQLDFVENNLKFVDKDKLVVLAFHIPLWHVNENTFRNSDRQRLFDLLKDYPNVLAMSAHTHLQRQNFYSGSDGWDGAQPFHEYNAGTTSGDWYSGKLNAEGVPVSTMRDGTPKGYALLRVEGSKYTIDYQTIGQPLQHQIRLYNPKVVANNRGTSAGIFANFYMGHQDSKVEYRIDNGEWKPMTWVEAADPDYTAGLVEWDLVEELMPGRRPSNAVPSTHLWRAAIPTNLSLGKHHIEVRATDMFGRVFTEKSDYRIAEPVAY